MSLGTTFWLSRQASARHDSQLVQVQCYAKNGNSLSRCSPGRSRVNLELQMPSPLISPFLSSVTACFVDGVIVSIEHHRGLLALFFPIKASRRLLTNVVRRMQEMLSWYRGSIKQETMSLTLPFV